MMSQTTQAKQRETGHDIDARLLMYADAIERTQQRAFSSNSCDAAAANKGPDDAPDLPHLHINIRCDVHVICRPGTVPPGVSSCLM